ncbi:DNA-binding transcriptional regulator, LysR family [Thalassococcus halodurans]|uniref:DNA-binding transcriptional regulator, LysR family n=1 Tax=Thalassococcus halodurans TaxID=373675 RepID=A0A1H5T1H6_9RHOB|nr:LysR substrate-binding domain-containing protein [Thalassococcus halodurans]SEF56018.1 DNA-binding transcriptional regulator, LysR family [Thalassococcus halodurans]
MIDLTHLRSFVAVAEELNFTRAARRLNMTQPPLSRQIALLEHEVGVKLLDRTNRSVRLTAAGKRLLVDAIDILMRTENATLYARQAELGEVGAISLGFVPSAAIELIPQVVEKLQEALPGVQLTLREMLTYEQIEALMAGTLDIGIFRLPKRRLSLPLRKIWSEGLVLAIPRSHPLAEKEDVSLRDLDDEPFIGFAADRGGFLIGIVQGMLNAQGVSPRLRFSVSQSHTIMSLVNQGLGLSIVPACNRKIAQADTVIREIEQPMDATADMYMALGPKEPDPIIAEVAALIEATFQN